MTWSPRTHFTWAVRSNSPPFSSCCAFPTDLTNSNTHTYLHYLLSQQKTRHEKFFSYLVATVKQPHHKYVQLNTTPFLAIKQNLNIKSYIGNKWPKLSTIYEVPGTVCAGWGGGWRKHMDVFSSLVLYLWIMQTKSPIVRNIFYPFKLNIIRIFTPTNNDSTIQTVAGTSSLFL